MSNSGSPHPSQVDLTWFKKVTSPAARSPWPSPKTSMCFSTGPALSATPWVISKLRERERQRERERATAPLRLLMLEPGIQNALFDAVAELYVHLVGSMAGQFACSVVFWCNTDWYCNIAQSSTSIFWNVECMTFKWHKLVQLHTGLSIFGLCIAGSLATHEQHGCDSSPETWTEPPEPMMGDRKFWTRGDCGRFGGHFEGMVYPCLPSLPTVSHSRILPSDFRRKQTCFDFPGGEAPKLKPLA